MRQENNPGEGNPAGRFPDREHGNEPTVATILHLKLSNFELTELKEFLLMSVKSQIKILANWEKEEKW